MEAAQVVKLQQPKAKRPARARKSAARRQRRWTLQRRMAVAGASVFPALSFAFASFPEHMLKPEMAWAGPWAVGFCLLFSVLKVVDWAAGWLPKSWGSMKWVLAVAFGAGLEGSMVIGVWPLALVLAVGLALINGLAAAQETK